MKRKRFTEEQIAAVLKQSEMGVEVKDLCRKFGFTEQTFYRWKKQYAGMGVSELRELRQTREENSKLKRITEVVMTMVFLFVIMGATDEKASKSFAPLAIGLCLTLIHLVSIPVTNTSVNPARSIGPALFVGGWAIEQLWLFIVAPIIGASLGAMIYNCVSCDKE